MFYSRALPSSWVAWSGDPIFEKDKYIRLGAILSKQADALKSDTAKFCLCRWIVDRVISLFSARSIH